MLQFSSKFDVLRNGKYKPIVHVLQRSIDLRNYIWNVQGYGALCIEAHTRTCERIWYACELWFCCTIFIFMKQCPRVHLSFGNVKLNSHNLSYHSDKSSQISKQNQESSTYIRMLKVEKISFWILFTSPKVSQNHFPMVMKSPHKTNQLFILIRSFALISFVEIVELSQFNVISSSKNS